MVDNGVLRLNEAQQVHKMLCEDLGVNLTVVDASDLFLGKLAGVTDPEKKRKIIGNTFIEVFEEKAAEIEREVKAAGGEYGEIEWLLQGTLYPDVIESISFKGPSATIKTHHNVGGLLDDMKLKLIEPLRELFKGESLCVCEASLQEADPTRPQTRSAPSAVSCTSPSTLSAVTPSPAPVLPSASSARSRGSRSRSLRTPTPSLSRRSGRRACTTRSARRSALSCRSARSVSRATGGHTSRSSASAPSRRKTL